MEQTATNELPDGAEAPPAAWSVRGVVGEAGQLTSDASTVLASLPPGTEVRIDVLDRETPPPPEVRPPAEVGYAVMLGLVVVCASSVAVLALFGRTWTWTGFEGNGTLWSWLSLLMTPLAAAWLPIRLALTGRALPTWWKHMWAGVAAVFAVTIVLGYALNWSWTGFGDEALWDWLHLLLFPVVLLLLPEWFQRGAPLGTAGLAIAVPAMVAFALVIVGGYGWGWRWTGFTGNTFRDWLALLIAPFLLPAACRWFHVHWQHRIQWRGVVESVDRGA